MPAISLISFVPIGMASGSSSRLRVEAVGVRAEHVGDAVPHLRRDVVRLVAVERPIARHVGDALDVTLDVARDPDRDEHVRRGDFTPSPAGHAGSVNVCVAAGVI